MVGSVGYPGLVLNERFELLEIIGEGGMSVIFKALDYRQREMGEPEPFIALKILRSSFQNDPRFFTLLAQEAKKSQRLSHPNIVNVFDFDRDHDLTFMTMELLMGESLEHLLQKNALPTSFDDKKQIALQVLDAVIHAHKHDVVHADLKPSNVFVELAQDTVRSPSAAHSASALQSVSDAGGGHGGGVRAKVFDFGIARALHHNPQGFVGCSPAYATSATIEGAPPGPYDDAFGVGCVLYALFAGSHPFEKRASNTIEFASRDLVRIPALSHEQWSQLKRLLLFQFYPHDFGVVETLSDQSQVGQAQRHVLQWLVHLRETLSATKAQRPWRILSFMACLVVAVIAIGVWIVGGPERREQQVVAYLEQQDFQHALEFIGEYKAAQGDSPISTKLGDRVLDESMISIRDQLQPLANYDPQNSRVLLDLALNSFRDSERLALLAANFEPEVLAAQSFLKSKLLEAIELVDFCFQPAIQCTSGVAFFAQRLERGHPKVFELVRPALLQGILRGYALAVYQNTPANAQRIRTEALRFFEQAALEQLGVGESSKVQNKATSASELFQGSKIEGSSESSVREMLDSLAVFNTILKAGLQQASVASVDSSPDAYFWHSVYAYLVGFQALTPFQNLVWWNASLPTSLSDFYAPRGRDIRAIAAPGKRSNDHQAPTGKDPCAVVVHDVSVSQGLGPCQDQFSDGVGPALAAVWLADARVGQEAYGLAVSRYELAWQDLDVFCQKRACGKLVKARSDGPALQLPEVVLEGYLEWLSQRTGYTYRLLRLEEWRLMADPLGLMDGLIGLDGQPAARTCQEMGYESKGAKLASTSVFQGRYNRFGIYNLSDLSPEIVISGAQYLLVPGRFERFRRCRIGASAYEYPYAAYRVARSVRYNADTKK